MKKIIIQVFAFLLLWDYSACAENFSSVTNLIAQNKYEEAIQILEPLAQAENGDAQNRLGEIYHLGAKSLRDYTKAKDLYIKAVKNKNGEAANHLARMYMNGEGVNRSAKKAIDWYKQGMLLGSIAAERNYYHTQNNAFYYVLDKALMDDSEALFAAASLYHFGGEGIQPNIKRAFDWYNKAFSLGHKEAATRLGRMYMNGESVPKDPLKAKEWYKKGSTKI